MMVNHGRPLGARRGTCHPGKSKLIIGSTTTEDLNAAEKFLFIVLCRCIYHYKGNLPLSLPLWVVLFFYVL